MNNKNYSLYRHRMGANSGSTMLALARIEAHYFLNEFFLSDKSILILLEQHFNLNDDEIFVRTYERGVEDEGEDKFLLNIIPYYSSHFITIKFNNSTPSLDRNLAASAVAIFPAHRVVFFDFNFLIFLIISATFFV